MRKKQTQFQAANSDPEAPALKVPWKLFIPLSWDDRGLPRRTVAMRPSGKINLWGSLFLYFLSHIQVAGPPGPLQAFSLPKAKLLREHRCESRSLPRPKERVRHSRNRLLGDRGMLNTMNYSARSSQHLQQMVPHFWYMKNQVNP